MAKICNKKLKILKNIQCEHRENGCSATKKVNMEYRYGIKYIYIYIMQSDDHHRC